MTENKKKIRGHRKENNKLQIRI